jgi:hypothetical protein
MGGAAVQGPGMAHGPSGWVIAAIAVGAILQLVVAFFTNAAIGLISVPVWAIVLLVGAWVAATVLLVRTVRRVPLVALVIPAANAAFLWAVVAAGGAWLGWTA